MRTMLDNLAGRFMPAFLRKLAAFGRERSGNVALTFAIATLPIVGTVGYAVDYSHANNVKAALQAALDSAALMLARDAATVSSTDLNTKALNYVTAMLNRSEAKNLAVNATYTTSGGSKVVVNGSVDVPNTFLGIIGQDKFSVSGSSTTQWGSTRLRVALALDTTGSMASDGKMTALKSATKDLLKQLKAATTVNGDVYVSIIPFSRGVNLGAANYNASWIDWSEWEAEPAYMSTWLSNSSNKSTWDQTGPGDDCPFSSSKTGFTCTANPSDGASNVSRVPSSGTYSGYICPGVDTGGRDGTKAGFYYPGCYTSTTFQANGSSASCSGRSNCSCSGSGSNKVCKTNSGYYEHTWVPNARSTWTGCVADRGNLSAPGTSSGNDQTATAPSSGTANTLFPARNDTYCPTPSVGLNYNWTSMDAIVDGLDPNGGTNQPIGLVTAWHSLVGIGPFVSPPKDSNYQYTDVIILMSDGLNTWDRWYGNGSAQSQSVDYRMYDSSGNGTCANIKNSGVQIYTIHVNTDGDPTSALLRNCAGSKDKMYDISKFFTVTSASGIAAVFNQIGTSLTQLRVAK